MSFLIHTSLSHLLIYFSASICPIMCHYFDCTLFKLSINSNYLVIHKRVIDKQTESSLSQLETSVLFDNDHAVICSYLASINNISSKLSINSEAFASELLFFPLSTICITMSVASSYLQLHNSMLLIAKESNISAIHTILII